MYQHTNFLHYNATQMTILYKCKQCGYLTIVLCNLQRHCEKKHKIEQIQEPTTTSFAPENSGSSSKITEITTK